MLPKIYFEATRLVALSYSNCVHLIFPNQQYIMSQMSHLVIKHTIQAGRFLVVFFFKQKRATQV